LTKSIIALIVLALAFSVSGCQADSSNSEQSMVSPVEPQSSQNEEPDEDSETSAEENLDSTPEPSWKIGEFTPVAPEGVSAHLAKTESGYRLAYGSYNAGGWVISECTESWDCQPTGTLDRVADLTVVTLSSGDLRAYFVEINPENKQKEIFTAQISEDWLSLTNRESLGFNDGGQLAWGVPGCGCHPRWFSKNLLGCTRRRNGK